jgi:transcriptional regulator
MSRPTDLVQGTLDLLILKTIALEPMHGWAIGQRIRLLSQDVLKVQQGSLYPALHKLEHQGSSGRSGTRPTTTGDQCYSLTRAGEKRLARELESWDRLSAAITMVAKTSEL